VEAQSTVAEQNQIPYVNGGGASTSIYGKGFKWIFGTLASVENLSLTEMEWIKKQQDAGKLPKPAKVAVVWENTSHGEDFRKGIKDFAGKNAGYYDIVVDESFALDGKDFSAVLNKVKAAGLPHHAAAVRLLRHVQQGDHLRRPRLGDRRA
jgi:branched-chain amino acid transport system substrate-binding protein